MPAPPKFDPSRPVSATNIPERPLRTAEVAEITGFSAMTVRNYCDAGILESFQAGPGLGIRVKHESVRALLDKSDAIFGPY